MKTFNTFGPVNPEEHYVVSREAELADFIKRVKLGRYIVIFAPRQTGKTTFFQWALDALAADTTAEPYFPIEVNFEVYEDYTAPDFYDSLYKRIYKEIKYVFQKRGSPPSEALSQFLEDTELTDHIAMLEFFQEFANFLEDEKLVLIIDEFDGIPPDALRGFLQALRTIYVQRSMLKCPYSVGIVGGKSVTQLNLDRSISPFNIQDEFTLPNFTLEQVRELLTQYTAEVGQPFAPEVIEALHKQTGGQPFLVNRFAQILTEEMAISKDETIQDNFRDFIARAGFRILLVPDTPEEFIGQHLLYAYLDQFVQLVHGHIYLEGQTGRGKIDLAIFHNGKKYIVQTKIWEGPRSYQAGKKQLAAYLKLEGVNEGYYVVFDHRAEPEPRAETEKIDGLTIQSYIIPVIQEPPSQQT